LRHDKISDVPAVIPLTDGLSDVGHVGNASLVQPAPSVTVPTDGS
jgi:hypothetical protein